MASCFVEFHPALALWAGRSGQTVKYPTLLIIETTQPVHSFAFPL